MFDHINETQKKPIIRLNELTKNIRLLLEKNFSKIGIAGEISSFTAHSSGHWYFNLKDTQSQITVVMFRSSNQRCGFKPKVGDEVVIWGKVSVYEPRGAYQVLCEKIELAGEGVFQKRFEELKIKLNEEGLFKRKAELPYLPKHIAVITSFNGAALRDVLNVLNRRCKSIKVTIIPALMEGARCAESVIQGLRQANQLEDLDLILITRGGGSAESLASFNDEALARFAFNSPVPLVSAIGHEIDFTIMDFIADLRAPTPSAAAELISKNAQDLIAKVEQQKQSLISYYSHYIEKIKKDLSHYEAMVSSPISHIQDALLKIDDWSERLQDYLKNYFKNQKQTVSQYEALLGGLSPMKVMGRGYSLCFKGNEVISSMESLNAGDLIKVRLFKGSVKAQVKNKEKGNS